MADSDLAGAIALAHALGRPVEVAFGRARTRPVQLLDRGSRLRLRLHSIFEAAPPEIWADLAHWARTRQRTLRLDRWMDGRLAGLPAPRVPLRPRGRWHDLRDLRAALLAGEFRADFAERPPPGVTWGRRVRSRARNGLRLGSYEHRRNVARIHPVLDRDDVPGWFVRFVLFHEILHAALPAERCGGRRRSHGPDFRARERAHPDHARARAWERAHIRRLVRLARRPPDPPDRPPGPKGTAPSGTQPV